MNYERVPQGILESEKTKFATGIVLVNSLGRQGLLPEEFSKTEAQSASLITSAVAEYKKGPLTPELMTKTFQTIWQKRGESAGIKFDVTPCHFTREELAGLEAKGLRLGYLPTVLATQESRHILGKIFPEMQSESVQEGNSVTNDRNPSGWFTYEAGIDAPCLGTTEKQLMDKLSQAKRQLFSENQYIVAGQDSKLFTGRYLDEGDTWVRVGSRHDGLLVGVGFRSVGRLNVHWFLSPRGSSPFLGGRSSEVNILRITPRGCQRNPPQLER